MAHTPGPWQAVLCDADTSEKWYDIWSGGYGSVAHLSETARTDEGLRFLHGDAHLLAAAPALIEALKDCEIQLANYHRQSIGNDAVAECACAGAKAILKARTAIALAKGKKQEEYSVPTITTITDEPERGCGFRKAGGIYLCSSGMGYPCGKLPLPLDICPTCGSGIHFARSWTWINPQPLFAHVPCQIDNYCGICPAANPPARAGLLWVGERTYKTPDAFTAEAMKLGVSRRIKAVPRDFKLGEAWVFVAHIKACGGNPGIFHAFKPQRIEYAIDGTESEEDLTALEKRGLTLIKLERTQPVTRSWFDDEDFAEVAHAD